MGEIFKKLSGGEYVDDSRERILALVNHEEPDRIRIGYSAAPGSA